MPGPGIYGIVFRQRMRQEAFKGGERLERPWWRGAVFYQIYIRSFADSNDDGIGDLPGTTSRLEYLKHLGVDAIWITPFYPSPQKDHGYDVADYYDVNPEYGTLEDFDRLVERAHELRLKVLVDLVPNHTSDQHPWFQAALSAPDDPHRARYYFLDPKPDGSPPNNWESAFGGSAWAKDERSGQWYLHLFAPEHPDMIEVAMFEPATQSSDLAPLAQPTADLTPTERLPVMRSARGAYARSIHEMRASSLN